MRGIHLLFATLMSLLLLSARAQSLVPIGTSSDTSISTSRKATTLMTNVIAVSSFLPASTTSSVTANAEALGTVTAIHASSTSTTASSSGTSKSNTKLIIIVATILGTLAIIAVGVLIYLIIRYRKNKSLSGRGVTPIDDEEIDSWRQSSVDRKQSSTFHSSGGTFHSSGGTFDKETGGLRDLDMNGLQVAPSPGWTWTASPTSSRSTHYPSGISGTVPDTPRFFTQTFAQAPNARVGLTDETIPGAEPFIKPHKAQGSRLSKSSPYHIRTKSRRSSVSGRSIWSIKSASAELKSNDKVTTWFDPEDDFRAVRGFAESTASFRNSNSVDPVTQLAPRPPARPVFWDRDSRQGSFWDRDPDIGEIGLAIS